MDVLAIAASGMQQDILRLESISQNMANVLTPAYKKQILLTPTFSQQVDGGMAGNAAYAASPAPADSLRIDATAGTLRYTARAQDVAIQGDGFFEISTPAGPQYTRQGSLHVDIGGHLVGDQGLPLMGTGGELVLTDAPFTIDPNGDVHQGERLAGRLKMVQFKNPEALQPVGGGLYAQGQARTAVGAVGANEPTIRLGYQENSNVNSAQEMVRLTETMRHFEALQKIMQGYDDALGKAITKLGEF